MKQILTITTILIFTLFSCGPKVKTENKTESKFERLSKYYQDTTFSDLFVYPDVSGDGAQFVFNGKQIDSADFKILDKNVTRGQPWTEGFYGIHSFKIDQNHLGLITRTPGEYASTVISLWIYDLKKDSIVNNVELADIFGDAGTAATTSSCLFFDRNHQLSALTYRFDTYDNSVEEVADSTIEKHYYYYLRKINLASIDTISTDSMRLNQEYKQQFIKMAGY